MTIPMNSKLLSFAAYLTLLLFWGCTPPSPETRDNRLVIRLAEEPDALLPPLTTSGYARQVHQYMYQYLMVQDPETFEYIPQLAKNRPEVERLNDQTTAYTYEIFEAASWDDGQPITGHDYVFTLKTILHPQVPASRYRPYLDFIQDVQVDAHNPKRFTVRVEGTYILAEDVLNTLTSVLPRHRYDPEGWMTQVPFSTFADPEAIAEEVETNEGLQQFAEWIQEPVFSRDSSRISGSGPYRFKEWISGQQIVLERKTDWWGDALAEEYSGLAAYPDRLVYRIVKDNASTQAALKAGELDVVSRIQAQSFVDLKKDASVQQNYRFYTPLALETNMISINTLSPKLQDSRVRRALAHAVDAEEIIAQAQQGLASSTTGPVHPSATFYDPELKPKDYQPEEAKQLLAEAGWKDSNSNGIVDKAMEGELVELELELLVSNSNQYLGLMIQNQAKAAGIGIDLVQKEFRAIREDLSKGNYELGFVGAVLSPGLWDPSEQWHTSKGMNRTGFGNPQTDQLIDSLIQTLDEKQRTEMYHRLQRIIYDQQPAIWLYVAKGRVIVHKRFEPVLTPTFPNFEARLFRSAPDPDLVD